jgi:protein O-GlcNAc transferase
MVLSSYHRARYPRVPDEKIIVTANGIDALQFAGTMPQRDPRLVVYGSDYNRGLRDLLERWPRIRAAVPLARLHVFYGWQGIEHRSWDRGRQLKRMLTPLLDQPGVRHLGRIGHAEVTAQYGRAGVWAYPCTFPETSCISAMKAQAAGAVPAVIPTGALRETVSFGFRTRYAHHDRPAYLSREELVDMWEAGVVNLLKAPELQEAIRPRMMSSSRNRFDWSRVVKCWEEEFSHA